MRCRTCRASGGAKGPGTPLLFRGECVLWRSPREDSANEGANGSSLEGHPVCEKPEGFPAQWQGGPRKGATWPCKVLGTARPWLPLHP